MLVRFYCRIVSRRKIHFQFAHQQADHILLVVAIIVIIIKQWHAAPKYIEQKGSTNHLQGCQSHASFQDNNNNHISCVYGQRTQPHYEYILVRQLRSIHIRMMFIDLATNCFLSVCSVCECSNVRTRPASLLHKSSRRSRKSFVGNQQFWIFSRYGVIAKHIYI